MFAFRPIAEADIARLHVWRNTPHVSAWWDPQRPSLELCQREYRAYMRSDYGVDAFIIVRDGTDIGYVQKWTVGAFPDYRPYVEVDDDEVGVDIFIGDLSLTGQGIGTAALRAFIADVVFEDPAVPSAVIDPLPENAAAIRSYEKVGFRHVAT